MLNWDFEYKLEKKIKLKIKFLSKKNSCILLKKSLEYNLQMTRKMRNQVLIPSSCMTSRSLILTKSQCGAARTTSIKAKTDLPRKIVAVHVSVFWKHPICYFETHLSPFRYRWTNTCNSLYVWRTIERWNAFSQLPVFSRGIGCQGLPGEQPLY